MNLSIHTAPASHPLETFQWTFIATVYDQDAGTVKLFVDGSVYKSTNYTTPTDIFSLTGYSLSSVTSTWFSYNGAYILYHTSDKYLVGFPLSIGIPFVISKDEIRVINAFFGSD